MNPHAALTSQLNGLVGVTKPTKKNVMKNYPKELIEEFNSIELYVCECGHTTSEIETRGTGDGDYWTPEGAEEFCPECDRADSFSVAKIEDYVYQLEQEGINIEDYEN